MKKGKDMMSRCHTDASAEKIIAEAIGLFRRVGDSYRRGLITKEDACLEIRQKLHDAFNRFFADNQLELRVDSCNYPQFADAFEDYQNGREEAAPGRMPWLFDRSNGSCEASENDRKQFFQLMKALHAAPDYFEPKPEDVPSPGIVPVHQYHSAGVYGIHFRCIDDGGLLADTDPTGKTFTLVNETGQKAVLTVKEDRRRSDRSGMDFDEVVCSSDRGMTAAKAEFLAEGSIEGYTAGGKRSAPEILIRLGGEETKVCWLSYWEAPEDAEVREKEPLWQEYYRWCREKEMRREEVEISLLNEYSGS